jgi:uncharacterized membrane protein
MNTMHALQLWLYDTLRAMKWATSFMTSKWGWPFCETVHFLGLSLLIGTIGMFDLRLLGVGRRVPIRALHALVPWGVSGYVLALLTGIMFLATEPDQYIFNPAFQWKVLFMALAGLNMATFYLAVFRHVGENSELPAKIIAALSLFLWIGVIVFGRMLTFYRPADCGANLSGFVLTCIPLR